jgi:hypothetical protein
LVPAAFGSFEDELLAGPVDVRCALQQVGAGEAELVQYVLDRGGTLRLAGGGWFGRSRAGPAGAGIAAGVGGGGPGGGEQVAGGPDGRGCLVGLYGRLGGSFSSVVTQAQQGVEMVAEGGREGTGMSMVSGSDRVGTRRRPALAAVRICSRWV